LRYGEKKLAVELLTHVVECIRAVSAEEDCRLGSLMRQRMAALKRCDKRCKPRAECPHHQKAARLQARIVAIYAARRDRRWLLSPRAPAWFEVVDVDYEQAVRQLQSEGLLPEITTTGGTS
jgi:hypothetical protein